MKILFLLLFPTLSYALSSDYIIETLDKEGQVQAMKMNSARKFSVAGGTITGRTFVANDLFITGSGNGICFPDATCQVTAGGGAVAIIADPSQFSGTGALAAPLTLRSSSVTLQGNAVNMANGLLRLDGSADVPVAQLPPDGYASTYVNASGDTMTGPLVVTSSAQINALVIDGGTNDTTFIPYSQTTPITYSLPSTTETARGKFLKFSEGGILSWEEQAVSGEAEFFFSQELDGTFPNYFVMYSTKVPAAVVFSTAINVNDMFIGEWITPIGYPQGTMIADGNWEVRFTAQKTGGTKDASLYGVIKIKASDGSYNKIIGTTTISEVIATAETRYFVYLSTINIMLAAGDRINIYAYAKLSGGGTDPTIDIKFGEGYFSHLMVPQPAIDTSNFVPYSGANSDLNMGAKSVSAYGLIASSYTQTPGLCLAGECKNAWPVGGDNFGNHIATKAVSLAGFSVNNVSAIYNDGSVTTSGINNTALLSADQTFAGSNTFSKQIVVSSNTLYAAQAQPAGVVGAGVMYYDTALNVFMVKENNGVAKPIVDPPGNWTCTIRSAASSCASNNSGVTQTATASCTGNEKMLSYSTNHSQYNAAGCGTLAVNSDAWLHHGGEIITNQTVTTSYSSSWPNGYSIVSAYVNCCQ